MASCRLTGGGENPLGEGGGETRHRGDLRGVAVFTAARLPNRSSSRVRLSGPMPGMSSNSEVMVRASAASGCRPRRSGAPRRARAAAAGARARAAGAAVPRRGRRGRPPPRAWRATRSAASRSPSGVRRRPRRAELPLAAVDDHQVGQRLGLVAPPRQVAGDHLVDGGEVVLLPHALDLELPVLRLLRAGRPRTRPATRRCRGPGWWRCRRR